MLHEHHVRRSFKTMHQIENGNSPKPNLLKFVLDIFRGLASLCIVQYAPIDSYQL